MSSARRLIPRHWPYYIALSIVLATFVALLTRYTIINAAIDATSQITYDTTLNEIQTLMHDAGASGPTVLQSQRRYSFPWPASDVFVAVEAEYDQLIRYYLVVDTNGTEGPPTSREPIPNISQHALRGCAWLTWPFAIVAGIHSITLFTKTKESRDAGKVWTAGGTILGALWFIGFSLFAGLLPIL